MTAHPKSHRLDRLTVLSGVALAACLLNGALACEPDDDPGATDGGGGQVEEDSGSGSGGSPGSGGSGSGGDTASGGSGGSTMDGGTGGGNASGGSGGGDARFTLTSPAFGHLEDIPVQYTCDGDDISPPFEWMNPPEGTASFALSMTDIEPTIPVTQWVIWNIRASASSLAAGQPEDIDILPLPAAGSQANADNSDGHFGYVGPCPQGASHKYLFRLYALDVAQLPDVPENPTARDVVDAILGHIIDFADVVGRSDAGE